MSEACIRFAELTNSRDDRTHQWVLSRIRQLEEIVMGVDAVVDSLFLDVNASVSPSKVPEGGEIIGTDKEEEDETGDPERPGKPSIPANHTTSSARLLLEHPITKWASTTIKNDKYEMFPIDQEERRGILKLRGLGEGLDPLPGYEDPSLNLNKANSEISSPWFSVPLKRMNAIGSDGLPDLTRGTVERYVHSYFTHLGNLHPILIPRDFNSLVKDFLNMPGYPSRSISTALVLLVIALGEICSCTTKIPDISELEDKWAASSSQISNCPTIRNLDVLPGLPYFLLATNIIGNQLGGNSLLHVRALILAGLYYAQLGRVLESHAYIFHASRALQVTLAP